MEKKYFYFISECMEMEYWFDAYGLFHSFAERERESKKFGRVRQNNNRQIDIYDWKVWVKLTNLTHIIRFTLKYFY
jgi:hypothetical protein